MYSMPMFLYAAIFFICSKIFYLQQLFYLQQHFFYVVTLVGFRRTRRPFLVLRLGPSVTIILVKLSAVVGNIALTT